jgi:hypothetical protein
MGLYKLKVQLNYGLYHFVQKREETVGKQKRLVAIQEK